MPKRRRKARPRRPKGAYPLPTGGHVTENIWVSRTGGACESGLFTRMSPISSCWPEP
jgi:hypothetical protein